MCQFHCEYLTTSIYRRCVLTNIAHICIHSYSHLTINQKEKKPCLTEPPSFFFIFSVVFLVAYLFISCFFCVCLLEISYIWFWPLKKKSCMLSSDLRSLYLSLIWYAIHRDYYILYSRSWDWWCIFCFALVRISSVWFIDVLIHSIFSFSWWKREGRAYTDQSATN